MVYASDTGRREDAELLFNSSQHEAAINGAFGQEGGASRRSHQEHGVPEGVATSAGSSADTAGKPVTGAVRATWTAAWAPKDSPPPTVRLPEAGRPPS